jgi:hypothetical protein
MWATASAAGKMAAFPTRAFSTASFPTEGALLKRCRQDLSGDGAPPLRGEGIRQGRRRTRHSDRTDYTLGDQLLQKASRPCRLEPGTAVSEPQDPRKQQDSNLAIAGVVAVIATAAIHYISGMFN